MMGVRLSWNSFRDSATVEPAAHIERELKKWERQCLLVEYELGREFKGNLNFYITAWR